MPKNLYEKLGGEEGTKVFVDKVMKRVLEDPQLKDYFKGVNIDLHNEKLRYYIGVMGGAHPLWIG